MALDRAKRAQVWSVVEQFRRNARTHRRLSWAELSSVAAAVPRCPPRGAPADHVLVDEAQDLTPSHWRMLRALVGEHGSDLFIAEDSHQRIYGQRVVLSRLGIKIVGRSRRLTLNYRTTQQNLRYALGVLEGGNFTDSEGSPQDEQGYRPRGSGPRWGPWTSDALGASTTRWRNSSRTGQLGPATWSRSQCSSGRRARPRLWLQQLATREVPATEKSARGRSG